MYKAYRTPTNPDVWYIKPHQSWFYRLVKWTMAGPFLIMIAAYVVYGVFFYAPRPEPAPALAAPGPSAAAPPLRPLPEIFQHPERYARMPITKAAKLTRSTPNQVKNIVIKTPQAHVLFETKDRQTVSYVDIEFKETAPCSQTRPFDDTPLFRAVGMDPSTLELARKATHAHSYYDHKNRLKITAICSSDGGPLSLGLSAFWYENR